MKKLKNILIFTATLLALTVVAHSFLPHDHHFTSDFDLDHHEQSNHSESQPEFHCFSFNNALLSKSGISVIIHIVKSNIPLLQIFCGNESLNIVTNSESTFNSFPKTELIRLLFSRQLPLRGSPLF